MGKIVGGDRIQCPYHGLQFDGTGACVYNPHGTKAIPPKARVKSYPAIEKHKAIWVWMGTGPPKRQDPGLRRARQRARTPHHQARQHRHPRQLSADDRQSARLQPYLLSARRHSRQSDTVDSEIRVEQDGDDVVVGRHAANAIPPGMFAPFWPDHPPRVDKFTKMRWMAPSTLRLVSGICKIGAPQDTGTGYHAIHMLTPESERSTHYFFTAVRWGVMTTDEKLNRDLQDKIAKMRRFAFEEQDAPVIEAQQKIIETADRPLEPLVLAIDVGPVRYKRILGKMLEAEQPRERLAR